MTVSKAKHTSDNIKRSDKKCLRLSGFQSHEQ